MEPLKPLSEETLEDALERLRANPFVKGLGIEILEKDGAFSAEVQITEDNQNPYFMAHGGLLYILADCIVGLEIRKLGKRAITLNADFNYLSNVSSGKIYAVAESVRVGRTVAVMRANVFSEAGKLLATGTFTFYLTE